MDGQGKPVGRRTAGYGLAGMATLLAGRAAAQGSAMPGDLSRQAPVEVVVDLGTSDGRHVFAPLRLEFAMGQLTKLVLRNPSPQPHYFTSDEFAASVWTRKVQVMLRGADGRDRAVAEVKGAVRELEVHPGFAAEWWFVPVQAGRFTDLRCGVRAEDGRTHAEHGMRGEIVVSQSRSG
jgi:uncharacterized cupredoxin-like copper-binding protein